MNLHTLMVNLCVVRVHAFLAREISLLQSQNPSLRSSTSPVQLLQANVENPQKEARPQASAMARWSSASSFAQRANIENSGAALWPYPSRFESPLSSGSAAVCVSTSALAPAGRIVGFGLGWSLLPVWRERLGVVPDGGEALPPKSSRLPRSAAPARQGEPAGLVSSDYDDPPSHTQTHPGLGLRRGCGDYQTGHHPGLDRAALPLPYHQSLAELPRPPQSPIGWQSSARSLLPAYPPSSRSPRRPPFANRAQRAERSGASSHRIARHTHDRARVSQKGGPFPSLSETSRTGSAHNHRQR